MHYRRLAGFAGLRSLTVVAGALLAYLVTPANAVAGTIRHDRLDSQYTGLATDSDFDSVGYYQGDFLFGSLTLIHPNWALTAAHVIDRDGDGNVAETPLGTLTFKGGSVTRRATQLIVPTGINGNAGWNGGIGPGFDIALVGFSTPITDFAPASVYTGFQELGKTVTMVGYGATGTGLTGSTKSHGTKRAGQNVIDELFTMNNGLTGLRWDFDDPASAGVNAPNRLGGSNTPLDLEYQIASGDSGGGSFIFENGSWYLAGVHSGTYDFFDPPGTDDSHTYGDVSLVTRVSAYQQFIFSNIPDLAVAVPEPGAVMTLAVAGLMAMGRRRRV